MKKITLLVIMFLMALNMNAQWVTDTAVNTLVADSESDIMRVIGMSDGKTYVVFWKVVPAPTNYELRMQVLGADGSKLLGADGILVSDSMNMSTSTAFFSIDVDANDDLYIGATATGDEAGHIYKLDSSGNQLWGESGITFDDAYQVKVTPISTGGAYVTWLNANNFTADAQMYDASGNTVWSSATQMAVAPSSPGDLFELSDGGFISVYHVLGSGVNSTLHAQRFNSAGISQWASPLQLSDRTTAFNAFYSGTQDGDTVFYGYKGKSTTRTDSYLQRINADGTIPWGINGMDFDTNETDFEQETSIAASPTSNYVWAISTYTNSNQSEFGEYVQKFDKVSGARQFTETAKVIFPIGSSKKHRGDLYLVNDQPVFLIEEGFDNGAAPTLLNACMLDANGDFIWADEVKPMGTFTADKARVQLTKPVNGQIVAFFTEEKTADSKKIYAQNLVEPELLSVSQVQFNNVTIAYANPIQNELNIKSDTTIEAVKIYDLLGKLVYKVNSLNNSDVSINTSSWNSGMYLMTLTTSKGQSKGLKIVKK